METPPITSTLRQKEEGEEVTGHVFSQLAGRKREKFCLCFVSVLVVCNEMGKGVEKV